MLPEYELGWGGKWSSWDTKGFRFFDGCWTWRRIIREIRGTAAAPGTGSGGEKERGLERDSFSALSGRN